MSNQIEPLNTAPIQQFIQQVRAADAGKAKEVKLDLQNARRLAFCLGEVMTRLEGDLEEILSKSTAQSEEIITVQMDGGTGW